MKYEWKQGTRYSVSAQSVGETVERLAAENGGVCPPSAVVDEARTPGSLLHPVIFRLGTGQAAEAHYRQEARFVVNHLTVRVEGLQARPAAFLSVEVVTSDGPRVGYAPRGVVVSSVDLYDQAVADALRSLNGWRRRYRHLSEFGAVIDVIDSVTVSKI